MNIEDLEQIMSEGLAEVECSAECGEYATVEPDGDYPCPCGQGRLMSPLVFYGYI